MKFIKKYWLLLLIAMAVLFFWSKIKAYIDKTFKKKVEATVGNQLNTNVDLPTPLVDGQIHR